MVTCNHWRKCDIPGAAAGGAVSIASVELAQFYFVSPASGSKDKVVSFLYQG